MTETKSPYIATREAAPDGEPSVEQMIEQLTDYGCVVSIDRIRGGHASHWTHAGPDQYGDERAETWQEALRALYEHDCKSMAIGQQDGGQ